MKAAALSALVDLLKVRTDAQRENLKTVQWYRENADARRAKPHHADLEDGAAALLGAINAISTRAQTNGDSGGQTGQPLNAATGTTGAANGQTEAGAGRNSGSSTVSSGRENPGSGEPTRPGGGGTTAEGTGDNVAGRAGLQGWKRIAAIATALAGAGGAGAAINNYFSGNVTPEVKEGLYPLLDWLEEQGHHLPGE